MPRCAAAERNACHKGSVWRRTGSARPGQGGLQRAVGRGPAASHRKEEPCHWLASKPGTRGRIRPRQLLLCKLGPRLSGRPEVNFPDTGALDPVMVQFNQTMTYVRFGMKVKPAYGLPVDARTLGVSGGNHARRREEGTSRVQSVGSEDPQARRNPGGSGRSRSRIQRRRIAAGSIRIAIEPDAQSAGLNRRRQGLNAASGYPPTNRCRQQPGAVPAPPHRWSARSPRTRG